MLQNVAYAQEEWDGYAPHGTADWIGIRRLQRRGYVVMGGDGMCGTCPVGHDTPLYVLTDRGRAYYRL